jgi:DnaJ-domain-containing protein 1
MERGLLTEAEAEFREVYQARRTVLGEQHPDSLVAREALDIVMQRQAE